ncbi:MAG: hypothetical protein ACRDZ7_05885 [Acidimicrobiia bacterium]
MGGLGGWLWFGGGAESPISDADARGYLDRMVAAAQARDFDALCDLNGSVGNCRRTLETACDPSTAPPAISCEETVPAEPPTVVSLRNSPGDGYAGRILVVRGVDAAGKPYETEVLVFRENRRSFKAINAVYWSGATIIEDSDNTQ